MYGLLGISGSQTGGQGVIDISIPELVQSGQTGISSTWPLNIPQSGKQTEYKLNVPSVTRRLRRVTSVDHRTARGTPPTFGESRSATMPVAA